MPMKSFRGKIADNGLDSISLHTNDGSIGYRIKKFELFPNAPGATIQESLVKIFSVPQTTATGTVDFADNTLLGSAYLALNASAYYATDMITIFDNMTFNQDIYLTHVDVVGSSGCNYYIELEQVKLDLNENTVATLKDIRNNAAQAI
jgi:hypothetical protein